MKNTHGAPIGRKTNRNKKEPSGLDMVTRRAIDAIKNDPKAEWRTEGFASFGDFLTAHGAVRVPAAN